MLNGQFGDLLLSLWYAIIAGVFYSLMGYFKRRETEEPFNGEVFITSILVGIIAGFIAFYNPEITPEQGVTMILAEAGILYFLENIAKAIWRRIILPWRGQPTPP